MSRAVFSTNAPRGEIHQLLPLKHYLSPYRWHIVIACIAIVFTSASVLGMGAGLRYLVDEGLGRNDIALLNRAYAILGGVIALLAFASYSRYFLVSWIGERVVADIRRDVYRHLISLHVGFFEMRRTGELLSRLTTDTTLLQAVISTTISVALRNALMFIGGFVLLLITSAQLTGYVFLMLPLVVMPILFIGRRVRVLSRDTQGKVADMNAHAEESLASIRTIQAMTMESMEIMRFSSYVEGATQVALSRIRLRSGLTALVIALVFGAVLTVLWVGGHDVMNGRISPGELSAFVFYAVVVAGALGALSEVVADLQRAAGAAERIQELLGEKKQIHSSAVAVSVPEAATSALVLRDISFTYPARQDKPALSSLNLNIAAGETVALVGPSGAGKSTIFQLILRFYDPEKGSIEFGGMDLRSLDLHAWRGTIGLVPQDTVIFSADVMTNIRAGRESATDEEVMQAACAAQAHEFIQKLPSGYATYLGEKGVQLSGGQRQRIAIARALVRNPRILLLDEATSALDAENERLVQRGLQELMKNRTTLVIAHRLSTVMHASRIVFLQEGKVEAVGTHDELLRAHPGYARLASLQLSSSC